MINNAINKIKLTFFKSNTNYFKKMSIEGFVIAVILCCVLLFLLASILRVWNNARNNYDIFNSEISGLQDLQKTNQELKDELNYVSSDEYKELFLKNTDGLASQNEELFERRSTVNPAEEKKVYLSLSDKNDYSDWWSGLLDW